ncbi:MAG: hypothetical protein GY716_10185 [bacterium]|nr:hypothetical protein [bacterium]
MKGFHIVFVAVSTLVAFMFGGWNLNAYGTHGGGASLAMGIGGLAFGVLLIVYGFTFWRKVRTLDEERQRRRKMLHRVSLVPVILILSTRVAPACTVCYGEAEGPMIDAARLGVFLLFGMTLLMQGAFVAFFVYLWRRARKNRPEGYTPHWRLDS